MIEEIDCRMFILFLLLVIVLDSGFLFCTASSECNLGGCHVGSETIYVHSTASHRYHLVPVTVRRNKIIKHIRRNKDFKHIKRASRFQFYFITIEGL